MQDSSLREDLLAIPGVEGAEVEGSDDRPAGLRIRIAEGADQRAVGGAIRRVLTAHGLGTDTRLPGEPSPGDDATDAEAPALAAADAASTGDPTPDPDAAAEPDAAALAAATAVAVAASPSTTDATDDPGDGAAPVIDLTDRTVDAGDGDGADAPVSEDPPGPEAAPSDPVTEWRLASVAVEEGRDGVLVRVATTTGAVVERHAASSEGGVESAVVRATAQLASPEGPEPTVVEIDDRRTEGVDIVTIVLDVDGKLHAGSAVVVAGRSFALGRATWAALSL